MRPVSRPLDYKRDTSGVGDMLNLLDELDNYPLEVLGLTIRDDKELSVTHKIVEMMSNNQDITTLMLEYKSETRYDVIMEILGPVLKLVKVFTLTTIFRNRRMNIDEYIQYLPAARHMMISGADKTPLLKKHLRINRARDATMIKVKSLKDKIPKIRTTFVSYERIIGMDVDLPLSTVEVIETLYGNEDDIGYDTDDEYEPLDEETRLTVMELLQPKKVQSKSRASNARRR